jgi:EAL domain-containing protein (putative c-di-GMP-specific phosphodiesterase class I)
MRKFVVEEENHIGNSGSPAQRGQELKLLLLAGDDDDWKAVVQNAADSIGGVRLKQTSSLNEAMSYLVVGDPNYSHLLVKSNLANEFISELAKLTAGESHNQTALVMLGADGKIPPRSAVVSHADRNSVTRAIISNDGNKHAAILPLKLEELHAALTGAQLHTRYQPVVRLVDHAPVGLEVLARLDHPCHGTLSPEYFVPQMENAGLSRRLTERVIERAFSEYTSHLAVLGLWLALNFPLDVLMDEPALQWLEQQRLAKGIPARQIMIELTESRSVDALDATGLAMLRRSIAWLRGLGYGLAIDDVGPAMANHKALFKLDFTSAKLDKGLVAATSHDPAARSFLLETITIAHQAGYTVVAEGVTDEATWDLMREAGADQAQGYFVARPLPAAAVPIWLHAWQQRAH